MSLKFTIEIRVPDANGTLTDADSTPTIGIIRTDTSAVVVAAGTAMTHDSTGIYSYTLASPVAGVTYRATWVALVGGATLDDEFDLTVPGDAWYYSNRTGVETVQDDAVIAKVWDMDGDGVEDAGLLTSDGVTADGYIDLFLADKGVTVPVVLTGDGAAASYVVTALADVSNHMTVWYGWHHRGLRELSSRLGRSPEDIAGMMSGYKAYADAQLEKIAGLMPAESDDVEGTFQSVPIVDSTFAAACDEFGCPI